MLDPIPPPSSALFAITKPWADKLSLPTLPHHIHEVLFALVLYQGTQSILSPLLSNALFPKIYQNLNRRTRINWDVHVVSMVQSCLINTLSLWVMFTDEERGEMGRSVVERVYGYTGASGLIQGLACGYFLWDLVVSTRYIKIFGLGIWAHAVTAFFVFSFGFRPFANYYGPPFILYELSSPFLNVHWFCDKVNLTGSKLQWYNGMVLLVTFFCCRLVWGTYQSACVYYDVWQVTKMDLTRMLHQGTDIPVTSKNAASLFGVRNGGLCLGDARCVAAQSEVMRFVDEKSHVPWWIVVVYLVSNLTLNALNWYWFGKMIDTVRKRFEEKPVDEDEKRARERRPSKSIVEDAADTLDHEVMSGPVTPGVELTEKAAMSSGRDGGAEVNKRRRDIRLL